MHKPWSLRMDAALYRRVTDHLFRDDRDEHGGVIVAGLAATSRGTVLLARDFVPAVDGIDFVPGRWGYRMLTAEFVRDQIVRCRDNGLVYLAVHNHHGHDRVAFSSDDNRSHERGYPALLDISQRPVGALVFAENAIAGDLWTPDLNRRRLSETVVVGTNLKYLYPEPPPRSVSADPMYDRQVRWFGDRGQERLARTKVVVIGAGGVGQVLVTMLARLGVGELVVIDPDRVEPTNLPRLPEATRNDALMFLRHGLWLERLANRFSTTKVRVCRRAALRANSDIRFVGVTRNVIEPEAAGELPDADFMFLAADSHQARMIFNAVAHQYLIPGIQLGSRIDVDRESGTVGDIRTNQRLVLPDSGCLRCNQLVSPSRLQEESLIPEERKRNRYVDEIPAPSVITLNTEAASRAATDFLMMLGGLIDESARADYMRLRPRERRWEGVSPIRSDAQCRDCGVEASSRRARGDGVELPLPQRAHRRRNAAG